MCKYISVGFIYLLYQYLPLHKKQKRFDSYSSFSGSKTIRQRQKKAGSWRFDTFAKLTRTRNGAKNCCVLRFSVPFRSTGPVMLLQLHRPYHPSDLERLLIRVHLNLAGTRLGLTTVTSLTTHVSTYAVTQAAFRGENKIMVGRGREGGRERERERENSELRTLLHKD